MKALIIGCGRVGASIALQLQREEWDVAVVDENEDALSRLGDHWPGAFLVGQVAQKRFGIECVVVRVLDPARADFYTARGLRTVCPTKTAIETLAEAVRSCEVPRPAAA